MESQDESLRRAQGQSTNQWLNETPRMPNTGANPRFWLFVGLAGILLTYLFKESGEPTVKANCGQIQGVRHKSQNDSFKYYAFTGIPYAAPPTGYRRWSKPEPLSKKAGTCWKGVFKADKPGKQCAQLDPFTGKFTGHEDCLVLDVFTPSLNSKKDLPVLVYFHGGYLRFGNISTPGFVAQGEVAASMNIVVVNVQYRLGALGFLVVDELEDRTGNYGFLDQIEALQWVKKNIRQFGGDPKKVTIAGQSSGGSSVLYLMLTPLARGLFQHAWSSSGSPVFHSTYEEATKANSFFVKKVGCSDADDVQKCLHDLTAEDITMAVFPEWSFDYSMDLPEKDLLEIPLAVVDGAVFTHGLRETYDMEVKGIINDVPLLLGTTAQEAEIFPDVKKPTSPDISRWSREVYENYVKEHLDTFSPEVTAQALSLYPYEENPLKIYINMVSDIRVNCPNDVIGHAASRVLQSPVYRYITTATPSSPVNHGVPFDAHLAFHVFDLLGFLGTFPSFMEAAPTQKDMQYIQTMRDLISSFMRTGKPSELSWKPFPENVGLIGERITVASDYHGQECNFWIQNGFFDYGWRN